MLNTITKIKIKFKALETYLPFIIKDEFVDNRENVWTLNISLHVCEWINSRKYMF